MSVLKALTDAIRDSCAQWLAEQAPIARLGVETVGTVTGPLPIVSGSGSPCRALALVERS
jgi:kynurenine formamidase